MKLEPWAQAIVEAMAKQADKGADYSQIGDWLIKRIGYQQIETFNTLSKAFIDIYPEEYERAQSLYEQRHGSGNATPLWLIKMRKEWEMQDAANARRGREIGRQYGLIRGQLIARQMLPRLKAHIALPPIILPGAAPYTKRIGPITVVKPPRPKPSGLSYYPHK